MIESIAHRLKMLGLDASEFKELEWVHLVSLTVKKVQLSVPTTWTGRLFNQSKKRSKVPFHIPFFIDNDANVAALGGTKGERGKPTRCCLHDTWYWCRRWYRRWRSSCTVYVELLVSLVTSLLTLMIQSNVPVVKRLSWNGCLSSWYRQLDSSLRRWVRRGLSIESLDRQRRRSNG